MNPVWLQIIGIGVLLVLLGALLVLTASRAVRDTGPLLAPADPCRKLLVAWQKAKSDCDEVRRAADIAHATAERREVEERATVICGRAHAAHLAYQACVKERSSAQAASRSR